MSPQIPMITVFHQHVESCKEYKNTDCVNLGYRTIVVEAKRSELSGHGILEVPNEALFQLKHDSPPSMFLLVKPKGRAEFLPRGKESDPEAWNHSDQPLAKWHFGPNQMLGFFKYKS